jgi:hypothetical protein
LVTPIAQAIATDLASRFPGSRKVTTLTLTQEPSKSAFKPSKTSPHPKAAGEWAFFHSAFFVPLACPPRNTLRRVSTGPRQDQYSPLLFSGPEARTFLSQA